MTKVLVLTHSRDGLNTLAVTERIEAAGHQVVRMDVDAITRGDHQLSLQYGSRRSAILRTPDGEIDLLREIGSVWFRRPYNFDFQIKDPVQAAVAAEEVRDVLDGLWRMLDDRFWVSNPAAITRARLKPHQLELAADFGLLVAPSLITNDPVAAKEFAADQPTVFKPMTGYHFEYEDSVKTAFTTLLTPEIIAQLGMVKNQHVLLQHCIEKQYELRTTFANGTFYTCRFDIPGYGDVIDWREPESAEVVSYTAAQLPDDVEDRTRMLLEELNLQYAAVDFAVNPLGDHFFLEVNPVGQWLWIEEEAGLPISAAIAASLIEGGERNDHQPRNAERFVR